jgi:hypothetical protein
LRKVSLCPDPNRVEMIANIGTYPMFPFCHSDLMLRLATAPERIQIAPVCRRECSVNIR